MSPDTQHHLWSVSKQLESESNQVSRFNYQFTDVVPNWEEKQRAEEHLKWHHKDTISKIQSVSNDRTNDLVSSTNVLQGKKKKEMGGKPTD